MVASLPPGRKPECFAFLSTNMLFLDRRGKMRFCRPPPLALKVL
jgi:hypothetical protein